MIAHHGSPSWKLKCIVAEVGYKSRIYGVLWKVRDNFFCERTEYFEPLKYSVRSCKKRLFEGFLIL